MARAMRHDAANALTDTMEGPYTALLGGKYAGLQIHETKIQNWVYNFDATLLC